MLGWVTVAAMLAVAALGAGAGGVAATDVTPVLHEGNVQANDCPEGTLGVKIDGSENSGSVGGVDIDITYNNDKSLDWTATGGAVVVAFVKGGDAYNEYDYDPARTSDTGLVAPNNASGGPAGVSHTVFCVVAEEPSASVEPSEEPSESVEPSEEPSASVEPSEEPSASVEPSEEATPSGGVEGQTGAPGVTPPSTSTDLTSGTGSSSDSWRIILVGMAVLLGGLLFLAPSRKVTRRR